MLTPEQIEFYHKNGYLGVEDVFSQEEVGELRRVTDDFVEQSRTVTENDAIFDLEPDHTPAVPKLRRLKAPTKQHPVYDQALRHDKLLDIIEQLIGPGLRYNGDKLNMKLPEFGSPVQWHQDWAFYPHSNDDLLAVGVALDDMSTENGCLLVIPGSHKGKIYDHHQDGHFVGAVTEEDFVDTDAAEVHVKAGGVSIHHVRTLHASLPNISTRSRRLLLLQYCAADSWPVHPGSDWEKYQETFLRGEPSQNIRTENVPIRLPLPGSLHPGSIYENQKVLAHTTFKTVAPV